MAAAIRDALPAAMAIALSALPILAIVLMMVTSRPARVSIMFLLGWAAGIAAAAGIIITSVDVSRPGAGLSTAGAIVRIVLGVVLGVLAAQSWRRRRGSQPPKWIAGVMRWSPPRAFAVAMALGTVSPKNIALIGAGATSIVQATSDPAEQALTVVVFATVASLGIATPIVVRAIGGNRASQSLERAAGWMRANGQTIATVVLAIIAVMLVATGIGELSRA